MGRKGLKNHNKVSNHKEENIIRGKTTNEIPHKSRYKLTDNLEQKIKKTKNIKIFLKKYWQIKGHTLWYIYKQFT